MTSTDTSCPFFTYHQNQCLVAFIEWQKYLENQSDATFCDNYMKNIKIILTENEFKFYFCWTLKNNFSNTSNYFPNKDALNDVLKCNIDPNIYINGQCRNIIGHKESILFYKYLINNNLSISSDIKIVEDYSKILHGQSSSLHVRYYKDFHEQLNLLWLPYNQIIIQHIDFYKKCETLRSINNLSEQIKNLNYQMILAGWKFKSDIIDNS